MARRVVLIGPMGSGKSSVGRALARRLGTTDVDTDDLVEAAAGLSIPEIFAKEGEDGFREREGEALQRALTGTARVVSTGGGIVTTPRNRELLAAGDALVVWLDASIDVLARRVGDGRGRPLLEAGDVRATLESTVAERAEAYAATADLHLDTTSLSTAECVDAIVARSDPGVPA